MSHDLAEYSAFAQHLADIGRAMLQAATHDRPAIEIKADRSFVTALDKAIEQRLRLEITKRFPDHGIIGEEEGIERPNASFQWVLDPIDGTAPFIAGVPVYGTLVAFAIDRIPVIGVMDLPAANNRWLGRAGEPTTHNGKPCRTSVKADLASAVMACMNPDFFTASEKRSLEALKAATAWRIYGTSSMGYGLMASGRIDLALDTRLQVYDYACYRPILEGAGGIITDWKGRPITLDSGKQTLAASNRDLHEKALDIASKA